MRAARWLAAALLCAAPALAQPATLELGGYQGPDGAITLAYRGDQVDPYFALRALLTARAAGLDTDAAARAWIAWLLPRQLADGSFARYCRRLDAPWKACLDADADDALAAMWAELLYLAAPPSGLPAPWARSAALALGHLARLRQPALGVYLISERNRVGLFMDNLEIHAALAAIGRRQQQLGQAAARRTLADAAALQAAIWQVFGGAGGAPFRVSTQAPQAPRFYPEQVAQLYPLLYRLPGAQPAPQAWRQWLQAYGAIWLGQQGDTYPWGLVALAARAAGDGASAACWTSKAAHLRYGARWNVLEEAVYQSLSADRQDSGALCVGAPVDNLRKENQP